MKDELMAEFGRRGGKAGKGQCKARDSVKMREAALKRWHKEIRAVAPIVMQKPTNQLQRCRHEGCERMVVEMVYDGILCCLCDEHLW